MKTSYLTGAALDWAVAKCEGIVWEQGDLDAGEYGPGFAPATNWAQSGPIIEREGIATAPAHNGWTAVIDLDEGDCMVQSDHSPTPLIAAMRCYVASKLGDEIEMPEELQ